MKYLLETDAAIDWLNGHSSAESLRPLITTERLGLSLISYGEIYEGIYYGSNVHESEQVFGQFLRFMRVLPLTRPILRQFARIRGDLRNRGLLIGDADTLIAATALHHDLTLVTRNRRHFQRIVDLKLYEPTAR